MEVEGCGPSLPAACSAGSQILQMPLIFPFSSLPRALGATWSWLGPGGDQEAVGGICLPRFSMQSSRKPPVLA